MITRKNNAFVAKIVNTRLTKVFMAIFAPNKRLPSSATLLGYDLGVLDPDDQKHFSGHRGCWLMVNEPGHHGSRSILLVTFFSPGTSCPLPGSLPNGRWTCETSTIPILGTSFLDAHVQSYPGEFFRTLNLDSFDQSVLVRTNDTYK